MRHFIFLFSTLLLLQFATTNALAQCGQLDSLYRILRVAKLDVDKINTLNALADELSTIGKEGQAAFYTKQALRLAEKAGYEKGIADALTRVALIDYKDLGKLSKSVDDFKKALEIYEELGDKVQKVRTLGIIANFYYRALDDDSHQQALDYFKRIAVLQHELGNLKAEAEAYESIGTLHGRLYQDKEAYQAYEKAHLIKTKIGLSTPTNERILAKYRRLNQLESHIKNSNNTQLATGFGIAIAIMLVLIITLWVQRNRALQLLKKHNPELLVKKPWTDDVPLPQS